MRFIGYRTFATASASFSACLVTYIFLMSTFGESLYSSPAHQRLQMIKNTTGEVKSKHVAAFIGLRELAVPALIDEIKRYDFKEAYYPDPFNMLSDIGEIGKKQVVEEIRLLLDAPTKGVIALEERMALTTAMVICYDEPIFLDRWMEDFFLIGRPSYKVMRLLDRIDFWFERNHGEDVIFRVSPDARTWWNQRLKGRLPVTETT